MPSFPKISVKNIFLKDYFNVSQNYINFDIFESTKLEKQWECGDILKENSEVTRNTSDCW